MLNPSAWSNWTRVVLGKEEVAIDFAALDSGGSGQGILLAQLVLPPDAALDLRDALIEVTEEYTGRGKHPLED